MKQPPEAKPVPLPEITGRISGRTFVFEPNLAQIESARLDFDSPEAVTLHLEITGEPEPRTGDVGLDGNYRMSHGGMPWIARGSWLDAQTLVIEFSEGPGLNDYVDQVRFENDKVIVEIVGFTRIEGKLE